MDRRWISWVAIALVGGAVLAPHFADRAFAQAAPGGERFVCRSFAYDPHKTPEFDTRDSQTELGRWVLDREERGWQVSSVAPQVVIKATGIPEAWAHVCMTAQR